MTKSLVATDPANQRETLYLTLYFCFVITNFQLLIEANYTNMTIYRTESALVLNMLVIPVLEL